VRFALLFLIFGLLQAGAQTRADLTARFGAPRSEIFRAGGNIKLTATYDDAGGVCAIRIETPDHSDRVAPNLTDERYWIESEQVTELIKSLIPAEARSGEVRSRTIGLRVGERMRVESDDAVEITRIQRSRPLLPASERPIADRLVRIVFRKPNCEKLTR
jgi:hypothetical protein